VVENAIHGPQTNNAQIQIRTFFGVMVVCRVICVSVRVCVCGWVRSCTTVVQYE
jgi:hypothetical protein